MHITALAVIAGIAIGAWFRPLPNNKASTASPPPTYTDRQVADAKADVCAAYQKVSRAVAASHRNYGDDPVAKYAVAEGGWQALDAGSGYLLTTLAGEPATSPDLAQAVRKLANVYQNVALDYMADVSDSEIQPLLRASEEAAATIDRLCK